MLNTIIPFMKPDITQAEIDEVVDTMKSGWLTTGPKTKQFENEISLYCSSEKTVCLNSATLGLKLLIKLLDIKEGDEIITTPYTFVSTCNEILHSGAKLVLADIKENSFNIDPAKIKKKLTKKTKAVIPVDIAGWPCDYDNIYEILNNKLYSPEKNTIQECFDRPIIIADSAHSFGAIYKNKKIGNVADFTVFSFHATKNLTTAEGGAITFNSFCNLNIDTIYKNLKLLSLHGQSKDGYDKLKLGGWKYSIELSGFKCNMPDILAAIGLSQLKRYDEIIERRKNIFNIYNNELNEDPFILPHFKSPEKETSYHLFLLRIKNIDEEKRDLIIHKMANKNIACNVHFIPVVMQPFYKKLGYNIKDFPNTYNMYKNEISLPLYSTMSEKDVYTVCRELKKIVKNL